LKFDELSNKVIGCAIEVHRNIGPGLLESAYQRCLAHEFQMCDIPFLIEYPLPVEYKAVKLDCGYRADFVVDGKMIIELKSVEKLIPIHEAQLLTYMKLAKVSVGLLMNFNVSHLRHGIKRMVL
jgi:GxxExxY protein